MRAGEAMGRAGKATWSGRQMQRFRSPKQVKDRRGRYVTASMKGGASGARVAVEEREMALVPEPKSGWDDRLDGLMY